MCLRKKRLYSFWEISGQLDRIRLCFDSHDLASFLREPQLSDKLFLGQSLTCQNLTLEGCFEQKNRVPARSLNFVALLTSMSAVGALDYGSCFSRSQTFFSLLLCVERLEAFVRISMDRLESLD